MTINLWKLSTLVLLGGLAASAITESAEADRQPRMRSALTSLKSAKVHLQKATSDKGGHRVKAISLVDAAIAEVEAGIKFDNQH